MNMSSTHKAHPRKHAVHSKISPSQSPAAHALALIRGSAIALGCSLGVALLLLLLSTALVSKAINPSPWMHPTALAILYTTALLCGAMNVRISGTASWLCGLVAGILLLALCLMLGCFLPTAESLRPSGTLLTRLPIPIFSLIGAYLGQQHPKKRAHRSKKQ